MYKMMLLDLDGTLLNDHKEVPQENIDMLNKVYNEKGVLPIIATGKKLTTSKKIVDTIGECCKRYIITSNGGIIKTLDTNEYINKQSFLPENIASIIKEFRKHELIDILIHTENDYIIEKINPRKDLFVKAENAVVLDNFEESKIAEPLVVTVSGEREVLNKAREELKKNTNLQVTELCKFSIVIDGKLYTSDYFDIMPAGVTKKNAINMLADYLEIKREEIIVVGDGGNDLPMFEMAGLKVAMANAEEYLKEKADYVTTKNNNESGVAEAIRHIFNM